MLIPLTIFSFSIILKFSSTSVISENLNGSSVADKKEIFSAAPNNTPVTRVYVFGKPVYIRQPFVIPQRNVTYGAKNTRIENEDEMQQMLSRPNLFENRRSRQSGSYALRPSLSSVDQQITSSDTDGNTEKGTEYPLKQCYTERSGFMCCNRQLETVMEKTVQELVGKKWKNCNITPMVAALQKNAKEAFGMKFEAIVGVGDFASKIHFYSDYVCKMERVGRYLLTYATPGQYHNKTGPYL